MELFEKPPEGQDPTKLANEAKHIGCAHKAWADRSHTGTSKTMSMETEKPDQNVTEKLKIKTRRGLPRTTRKKKYTEKQSTPAKSEDDLYPDTASAAVYSGEPGTSTRPEPPQIGREKTYPTLTQTARVTGNPVLRPSINTEMQTISRQLQKAYTDVKSSEGRDAKAVSNLADLQTLSLKRLREIGRGENYRSDSNSYCNSGHSSDKPDPGKSKGPAVKKTVPSCNDSNQAGKSNWLLQEKWDPGSQRFTRIQQIAILRGVDNQQASSLYAQTLKFLAAIKQPWRLLTV